MAFTIELTNGDEFNVDFFSKAIMFQNIIDMDINKNTRSLLLYVLRKTLYFDKLVDSLSMYHLQKKLELGAPTLRTAISNAEDLNLIFVKRSLGGNIQSRGKYNEFRLSDELLIDLIEYVNQVREDNDFK